ncbi:MAG TPA: hypothetical protein VFD39_08895, partial [Trueperaceae bacterium]|nr:hypothetical protein [Trueperaceae bacterium]
ALGDVITRGDGVLAWHGAEGVVTFFAGSADALLQRPGNAGPDEWVLSAPVLDNASALGWALPLDAVQLLGVAFAESGGELRLHSPAGETYRLVAVPEAAAPARARKGGDLADDSLGAGGDAGGGAAGGAAGGAGLAAVADGWEMTAIDGVPALRFFAAPDKSLLLIDLDLAPLAFPEATAAIDEAVATMGSDNALLLVVSALSRQSWSSSLVFEQDGRSIEVRHPYRLRVFQGDPAMVGPAAGVAAVVLLPASFSLYRPLMVAWGAIDATVTFRR